MSDTQKVLRKDATMGKWNTQLKNMTNNSKAANVIMTDELPRGYVIKKEPKSARRTFAMQYSLIDALQDIAREQGTNINHLVNDVLNEYVNNYLEGAKKK